jgi:hypothetical protein
VVTNNIINTCPVKYFEREFEMDYPFESAWDKLTETLGVARMTGMGPMDSPSGYDLLPIEQVVDRFLRAYPKFEECKEKLLARLREEHSKGDMEVPRGCQLAAFGFVPHFSIT